MEFVEPRSFAAAMQQCKQRLAAIRASIDGNKLTSIHADAYVLAKLGFRLGPLAKASKLVIADEEMKGIFLGARLFSKLADDLHELADAADGPGTRAGLEKLAAQFEVIESRVPAQFVCPMHCEEAKTYAAAGTCPVCHMNLKKITADRYVVRVDPVAGPLAAGTPATLKFTVRDPVGAPVRSFERVHEKLLHLLMVSKDLSWFAHEHPELQPDGTLLLAWTFPAPGEYTLFHDFTPREVGMQVVPVTLTVPGSVGARPVPLVPDASHPKLIDGYRVSLDTGGSVTIGGTTTFKYTIARSPSIDKPGTPVVDLEPYLGALGHLIIVSEDRAQFVHSHPREDASGKGPSVSFAAQFTAPGRYKAWAQFQHQGKVLTVPFVFDVTVPKQ